jgi:hypothetical protein
MKPLLLSLFVLLLVTPVAKAAPRDPAAKKAPASSAPDSTRSAKTQLRLEDITIEGDVDIPRVLFIESREHLRDENFVHHLFLPDAAQLGAATPVRRILQWSPQGEHTPWTP